MLATKTIDEIRDLAIEQVIGKYVTLKKAGSSYKGLSPFTTEKTPSFYVTPSKNLFKCFSSGHGGDAIEFVMQKEGVPFYEACKIIASDNGIVVEETEGKGKTPEQISEEKLMLDWVGKAQQKYRTEFAKTPSVNHYLHNRLFTNDSLIEWQFGFVPDWQSITPDLTMASQFEIGEKCGLVKRGNGNTWDFFHHRITLPIRDGFGKQIGFGGRLVPGINENIKGGKYINPDSSPIYDKSKTLFGLDKARPHFKAFGMAALVEGYLDVVKMHQEHWPIAVASCGTALTDSQAKTIKRYTNTVLILRDGDMAGSKAVLKDIPILTANQLDVLVFCLPDGHDPDSYFNQCINERLYVGHYYTPSMVKLIDGMVDGLLFLFDSLFLEKTPTSVANSIEKVVEVLITINNQTKREQYIKAICSKHKFKASDFTKPIAQLLQRKEDERLEAEQSRNDEYEALPKWVDRKRLELDGFVQLYQDTTGFRAGIYFMASDSRTMYRVTNFTIKPLYHIFELSNNRRLIEVDNTMRNSVVEMPTQAFVNQNMFETELLNKGTFRCEASLGKKEFKRITGWLLDAMPIAYELKTLGWQPEGFFAYSNAVHYEGDLMQYDELGMIKVEDRFFMSLGNSKIHRDERQTENPYENDLFLKYVPPRESINFQKWTHLFFDSYGVNAPFGIAFVFLTMFKDLVTRVTKMPLLNPYGQKGSGKSSFAESITWVFFSGKDAEGSLIKGFNLNPGQSTPFSFFNRLERFRNCPILMNEFDENAIENWKTGAFKASYDGEGREVGDGDTGKKRKTKIQKVQGTVILVGQYLAVKDDAAVNSRCIPCAFSVERLKDITNKQREKFNLLQEEEKEGLSGMLPDLLKYRPEVAKHLRKNFSDIQNGLMDEMRTVGYRIEARLISNYSIMLAATKCITDIGIALPYTYETFYEQAKARMIRHNQTLKDSSIVNQFWKTMVVLFDKGMLTSGGQFAIKRFPNGLPIKEGSQVEDKDVRGEVLLLRFSNVYGEYAKYHRERTGQAAQSEETLLMYLKEQTYFIGLTPSETFTDKRTSAYAFNYEVMKEMDIGLEKTHLNGQTYPAPIAPPSTNAEQSNLKPSNDDDLPF